MSHNKNEIISNSEMNDLTKVSHHVTSKLSDDKTFVEAVAVEQVDTNGILKYKAQVTVWVWADEKTKELTF